MTLDSKNIRQLTIDDFDQIYAIWEVGTPVAISNPAFDISPKVEFYKSFIKNALLNQTEAFKYWGYFEGDLLIAWHSLLPCQAAPVPYHLFAETSLYIKKGFSGNGLGQMLMSFSVNKAKENSSLAYVLGTCSKQNLKSQQMLTEVGFVKIGTVPHSTKENVLVENNNWMILFYVM